MIFGTSVCVVWIMSLTFNKRERSMPLKKIKGLNYIRIAFMLQIIVYSVTANRNVVKMTI